MKTLFIAALISLSVGIGFAYANNIMMLHVGSSGNGGGVGPGCVGNGQVDFTNKCNSNFVPTLGL